MGRGPEWPADGRTLLGAGRGAHALESAGRFFSGRDLFAPAGEDEIGPLVCLYGSAFSDWVTEKGYYEAGRGVFTPANGTAAGQGETERYTARVRAEVYGRYVMARRIMETDYFRAAGW